MLIRRILMNVQDGSPGSGSVPPASTTPAAPAAPESPSAPVTPPAPAQGSAIDVVTITKSITDGVFASLRRAGVLPGKPNPSATGTPNEPTGTPTAPTAPVLDARQGRALDRALTRAGHAANLDERAYQRVERSFADEGPDDVDGWVRDYFEGLGIKRATSAPATAVTTTTPATPPAAPAATSPASAPTTPPASDRGAPPPPSIPLEERKLQEMSEADRNEYLRRHGAKKYSEKLARDLVGSKVW